jgi:hypothetical protein
MISDDRRNLYEFGEGRDWKVSKVIEIKEDSVLGQHYHAIKWEAFMLVSGGGIIEIDQIPIEMEKFKEYMIEPLTMHTFNLSKGSILIGLCSELFNENDDYR